jgi:shikimate kinase
MASGKSLVGAELARQLKRDFLDLDSEIERRASRNIADLFRDSGEAHFRKFESLVLAESMRGKSDLVIALGGGTWIQSHNQELILKAKSLVVFLDAPVEELWRRIDKDGADSRPLVHDEASFRKLYEERRPYYLRAHQRVETTGKSPARIAQEIASRLEDQ